MCTGPTTSSYTGDLTTRSFYYTTYYYYYAVGINIVYNTSEIYCSESSTLPIPADGATYATKLYVTILFVVLFVKCCCSEYDGAEACAADVLMLFIAYKQDTCLVNEHGGTSVIYDLPNVYNYNGSTCSELLATEVEEGVCVDSWILPAVESKASKQSQEQKELLLDKVFSRLNSVDQDDERKLQQVKSSLERKKLQKKNLSLKEDLEYYYSANYYSAYYVEEHSMYYTWIVSGLNVSPPTVFPTISGK